MTQKVILLSALLYISFVKVSAQRVPSWFEISLNNSDITSTNYLKLLTHLESSEVQIEVDSVYCLGNPRFMVISNQSIYQTMLKDSLFFRAKCAKTTTIRLLQWKYQKIFIEEWSFDAEEQGAKAQALFDKHCASEYGLPYPEAVEEPIYYFWLKKGKQFYVVYSFDVNLENELMKKVIATVKAL
jgi:hypothetical protein